MKKCQPPASHICILRFYFAATVCNPFAWDSLCWIHKTVSKERLTNSTESLFLSGCETTCMYPRHGSDKCHQATFHIGFCTCINTWGGFINQLRQAFPNLSQSWDLQWCQWWHDKWGPLSLLKEKGKGNQKMDTGWTKTRWGEEESGGVSKRCRVSWCMCLILLLTCWPPLKPCWHVLSRVRGK